MPLGLILLGMAMFGTADFGNFFGWMSIVIGAVAFIAAVLQMIDPASGVGALSYLLPIIFYLVLGTKIYRLSKVA